MLNRKCEGYYWIVRKNIKTCTFGCFKSRCSQEKERYVWKYSIFKMLWLYISKPIGRLLIIISAWLMFVLNWSAWSTVLKYYSITMLESTGKSNSTYKWGNNELIALLYINCFAVPQNIVANEGTIILLFFS